MSFMLSFHFDQAYRVELTWNKQLYNFWHVCLVGAGLTEQDLLDCSLWYHVDANNIVLNSYFAITH